MGREEQRPDDEDEIAVHRESYHSSTLPTVPASAFLRAALVSAVAMASSAGIGCYRPVRWSFMPSWEATNPRLS